MKKQVNKLGLKRVETLSGEKELKENELKKMLERIKAFCKVSYQLYIKGTGTEKPNAILKNLESEPPNEFTKAA